MVLFRPKRDSFAESMNELCIKSDMSEVDDFWTTQEEHMEWRKFHQDAILVKTSAREFNDNRTGWQHSRFLYKEKELLGIIDFTTFADFTAPDIQVRKEDDGSYTAFVSFAGEKFVFYLGLSYWSERTQCTGYLGDEFCLKYQVFRQDNVEISRYRLIVMIYQFVYRWALKTIRTKG